MNLAGPDPTWLRSWGKCPPLNWMWSAILIDDTTEDVDIATIPLIIADPVRGHYIINPNYALWGYFDDPCHRMIMVLVINRWQGLLNLIL